MPVKGLAEPVEVYELVGAGAVRSRLHAAAARGLTRFVGRDSELDQLRPGAGAGPGRTRPGRRGGRRARRGQVPPLLGVHPLPPRPGLADPGERLRVLRQGDGLSARHRPAEGLLPIEDADEPRRSARRSPARSCRSTARWSLRCRRCSSLLDVPVEDAAWQRLDPPQRRQRTLDAVKRLLLRESQVQPLLLVFEDLHWIDAETQALLDSLVESLRRRACCCSSTTGPSTSTAGAARRYYRSAPRLRCRRERRRAAHALLGDDPSLAPLKRLLIARTEGNPFFLEESVRTLVETQGAGGASAGLSAGAGLSRRSRCRRRCRRSSRRASTGCSPEDKRLLQAAAVIGKDVPFALLRAIAELPEETCAAGSRTCRRPSSSTRPVSSRTSSTPSSMR